MKYPIPLAAALLCLAAALPARAQDDDRTFADWDVDRTRAFWEENASSGGRDCLETINEAMRVLYQDRAMKLGSTVDLTMAALARIGRAEPPIVMGFLDERGRETTGVTEPVELRSSVWDGIVARGRDQPPGWLMFGFSPLDGYHSIVLSLDNRNPDAPKIYWSDQWRTNGGFRRYETKEALDGEIERLTRSWWKGALSSKNVRFKSDAKLYPLIPAHTPPREKLATIVNIPAGLGIMLHTRPEVGPESYLRDPTTGEALHAYRGNTFALMGRRGQWASVEVTPGQRAWVHAHFVSLSDLPPAPAPAEALGLEGALTATSARPAR